MRRSKRLNGTKRLAAALLACVLLLSGCGGQEAAEGSTLSVCVGGVPNTFDPIFAEEPGDQTILAHLYENLMRRTLDKDGRAVTAEGVARSVETEEHADGTVTYTFRLRESKWSDGVSVRALDFEYAWQRLANPASNSPYASLLSIVCGYEEARAAGDMTLLQAVAKNTTTFQVTLKGHYDWFIDEVCTSPATGPLRQDVVKRLKEQASNKSENAGNVSVKWWSDPTQLVTNGPFVVTERDVGTLTLSANSRYDRKRNGPSEIIFYFGNAETAQELYEAKAVDVIWPLTEQAMTQRMMSEEGWTAEPELRTYTALFNHTYFSDENIRRALSLAIDRTELTAWAGVTARPAEGLVPFGTKDHETDDPAGFRHMPPLLDNDPETYEARCAQAVELLEKAGYSGSELGQLELLYADTGGTAGDVAEAVCSMWRRELGLNVTAKPLPLGELMTALRAGEYGLAILEVTAVCNDAECFLMNWKSDAVNNYIRYGSTAYDALMVIIAGAANGSARMGCLHDAEDLLVNIDCALAPLYTTGTGWQERETYTGALRDTRGWFSFAGVHHKPSV